MGWSQKSSKLHFHTASSSLVTNKKNTVRYKKEQGYIAVQEDNAFQPSPSLLKSLRCLWQNTNHTLEKSIKITQKENPRLKSIA